MEMYLLFVGLCSVSLRLCHGFASWMEDDFCDREWTVGTIVMNEYAVASDERHIKVYRENQELLSNCSYIPNEILMVTLSDTSGDCLFQTNGGHFDPGGCKGRRSSRKSTALIMPGAHIVVKLIAGWAMDHGALKITEEFVLRPAEGVRYGGEQDGEEFEDRRRDRIGILSGMSQRVAQVQQILPENLSSLRVSSLSSSNFTLPVLEYQDILGAQRFVPVELLDLFYLALCLAVMTVAYSLCAKNWCGTRSAGKIE